MTTKSMSCISLWQPWASLVAGGFKEYETRSWKPPASVIGKLLAIHASKRWTEDEKYDTDLFIRRYPETAPFLRPDGYQNPPLGAVVCVCRLIGYYKSELHYFEVSARERAFGDWSPGRFVWKLEVVKVPMTPIPLSGKQGVFQWEYEMP